MASRRFFASRVDEGDEGDEAGEAGMLWYVLDGLALLLAVDEDRSGIRLLGVVAACGAERDAERARGR